MNIHVILDPKLGPERLRELGVLAERVGIEGVWTSSLLGGRDPFVAFVPLAIAAKTLRMGPIAVNPFDTHPTRTAAALLTLNEMARGRAQIVIGGGAEALAGLNINPARRVRAVRECVALLRQGASGVTADFSGELYHARRFGCEWVSVAPPTIWVAANAPQMLAMAAEVADGIMMSDLPQPLLGSAVAQANRVRADLDVSLPPLQFSNFVAWHVYADAGKARAEARRWLAYRGISRRWVCATFMSHEEFNLIEAHMPDFYRFAHGGAEIEGVPERLLDRLVDHLTLTATPRHLDPVLEHLSELRDAGLTSIALRLYEDVEQSLALIGERIVPLFS